MKNEINEKNLKIGEYYTSTNGNIVLYEYLKETKVCSTNFIDDTQSVFSKQINHHGGYFTISKLRLSTPEEKHWLNECIRLNKYITKEDALLTFIKEKQISKFINENTVINTEGEIFKIGDKICLTNHKSQSNISFEIINFRWKLDKTEICAVVSSMPNGIGIDKIELVVEILQPIIEVELELSLLEQAKLKYPIGTKYKCLVIGNIYNVDEKTTFNNSENTNKNIYSYQNFHLYHKIYDEITNQWAEIIDDFILPEKWCILRTKENYKIINNYFTKPKNNINRYLFADLDNYLCSSHINCKRWLHTSHKPYIGYVEITFDQFKKYVLNEK